MKTLDQHNKEKADFYDAWDNSMCRKNDIACPTCGSEMFDSDTIILTASPPKRNIHCVCGYRGHRIA